MKLAPIIVFAYNRSWHIRQTIETLKKNKLAEQSELFIFSDGPKDEKDRKLVKEVRKYIKTIDGFKSIIVTKKKKNHGLAKSIITGVTKIVSRYGKVIVLEDDLLTSPYFLKFMNEGLNFYEKETKVASIHGYIYPIKQKLPETFFLKDPGCLGWATWQRGWELFEENGKKSLKELNKRNLISQFDYENSYSFSHMLENQVNSKTDSWAIRWYASLFLRNKLALYPGESLVFHNGSDGSGTHGGIPDENAVKLSTRPLKINNIPIKENLAVRKKYILYFKSIQSPLIIRLAKKILRNLYKIIKYKL